MMHTTLVPPTDRPSLILRWACICLDGCRLHKQTCALPHTNSTKEKKEKSRDGGKIGIDRNGEREVMELLYTMSVCCGRETKLLSVLFSNVVLFFVTFSFFLLFLLTRQLLPFELEARISSIFLFSIVVLSVPLYNAIRLFFLVNAQIPCACCIFLYHACIFL
ncbi:hypothetical protein ACQKWADRAFT_170542 [Trichoderma austrokoningii]